MTARVMGVCLTVTICLVPGAAAGQAATARELAVPRMESPPEFEDFLDMEPTAPRQRAMARVEGFTQRWPSDGQPERQKTVAYLGYTAEALHIVYVAFDSDPGGIRSHLVRREGVFAINDDEVEVRIDTFNDRRQSYYFVSNPLGVQLDAYWPEVGGAYDESFDAVWQSRGQRTPQGFVVMMTIPFKSLRFSSDAEQRWGIYLGRWIPRSNEWNFWPPISNRAQSFLGQMATLTGINGVSRGRGMQVIPYATWRSFKAFDLRDPRAPAVARDAADPRLGVDAKLVMRGSLVLDATVNPDFSQVESDAPQITTNQRFELFFPEKRPFFLENAGYLQAPIALLFTRRLADPQLGAKLTGRTGAWNVGGLFANDDAPGLAVARSDPLSGATAWAGVARVSRDLPRQSSIGAILTHRSLADRTNWVSGVDTRLRLTKTWTVDGQVVGSRLESAARDTPGYAVAIVSSRTGRSLSARTEAGIRSRGFVADLGFVPRVDVREIVQTLDYQWRPAKTVSNWGPEIGIGRVWAADGTPLDWSIRPGVTFSFTRATNASAFFESAGVGLRPNDAPNVATLTRFRPGSRTISASTSPHPWWSAAVSVTTGRQVNFAPAGLNAPSIGDRMTSRVSFGLRPLTRLRIENTWLHTSLDDPADEGNVFTTDIVRTQWAWQFTREWSLRFIGHLDETRADPLRTRTRARKNVNGDVLLTCLVNPWSALYVGYNGNLQHLDLVEDAQGPRLVPRAHGLTNDAWQVFVKWSHLLRW